MRLDRYVIVRYSDPEGNDTRMDCSGACRQNVPYIPVLRRLAVSFRHSIKCVL